MQQENPIAPFVSENENLSQVDAYDDRKRPCTTVLVHVNVQKQWTYGRKRAVNRTFGWDSITVVRRRVVYVEKRPSVTAKNEP
jgi:hypothetical protein